jgi:hypothetical protein
MMLYLKYIMPQKWGKTSDLINEKGKIGMVTSMLSVANKVV